MKIVEGKSVYSVSEVNSFARRTLEQMNFWVEGELSSFKGYNSKYRYLYFDLKDPQTGFKLPCVFDPETYLSLNFQFEDGMKVLVLGVLTLWEKEGKFQMHVVKMQEFGEGFLLAELEKLKLKLQRKGYFDEVNKKKLPLYPVNVAVITSKVSDAWQDFRQHSYERFKTVKLDLFDVMVQGDRSVSQIIKAIKNADSKKYDVICLIRGGGSIEDLAAFNDENLARTIFEAKTPVLVGVGHERDVTIASLVADVSASTPTDAAKIIIENFLKLDSRSTYFVSRVTFAFKNKIASASQQLDFLYQQLVNTKIRYSQMPQKLTFLKKSLTSLTTDLIKEDLLTLARSSDSLVQNWKIILNKQTVALDGYHHKLLLVSPQNVLNRGYSITTTISGEVLKNVQFIDIGQKLKVKLAKGQLNTKVMEKKNYG